MAQPALAEQYDIYLEMHQRSNHENDTKVNRAPMLLPIEVVYDYKYDKKIYYDFR